jgi:hypothetical protein
MPVRSHEAQADEQIFATCEEEKPAATDLAPFITGTAGS